MSNTKSHIRILRPAIEGEVLPHAPVIGIGTETLPSPYEPGYIPDYHGQSHQYGAAIIQAGGATVLTPHYTPSPVTRGALEAAYDRIDGVLLPGGYDVGPELYHGRLGLKTADRPVRDQDAFEEWITWRALKDGKPILGICRGMHMINVVLGGTLYQDLPQLLGSHEHSIDTHRALDEVVHNLSVSPGKLHDALGVDTINANSRHHQGIHKLGEGLVVAARSADGVIEAIESDDNNWVVGVECHPEALIRSVPEWQGLFSSFVTAAREHAQHKELGKKYHSVVGTSKSVGTKIH